MQVREFMDKLMILLNDKVMFVVFEVIFLGYFIYAILRDRGYFKRKGTIESTIVRGEQSWNYFNLCFGISSVVLMQIINSSEALIGYKTIISVVNLAMLLYLSYFNSWFRNNTINIVFKSMKKPETL